MNDPSLTIASLIASRLCHDLISPVGAICNGLEVLSDETDPGMRAHALSLIEASARQAAARLEFARMAYGVASTMGDEVDLGEARRLIEGLLGRGKVTVEWGVPDRAEPKARVKILVNLAHVAAECIPRGGSLAIRANGTGFACEARGPKARLAPDVRAGLFEAVPLDEMDSRQVQPYFIQLLLRAQGASLSLDESEDMVRFALAFPSPLEA